MSTYTPAEERELNKQLKQWKDFLSKNILSDKWDIIAEQLTELEIQQIKIITNADSYKDVNWLVWENIETVIKTIKFMSSKPNCFNNRLKVDYCNGQYRKDGYLTAKCRKCKWLK